MASKLRDYIQLSDDTTKQITGSYQKWTDFLSTAGRLYKYPFPEQLMIYAQRPDATACAEWDFWNQRMRRYIRRGSKGIALIDTSRGRPVLRYVFDVSDTGRMGDGLNPNLWQYREEHQEVVTAALERRFDVSGEQGLTEQLEQIAAQLAREYWTDHQYDILHNIDGSFLEGYDAFNIGAAFQSAASVSITYTLLSRCGLKPEEHFEHEDFLSIFDFNTKGTVTALGMAVSQSSEQVLRQIEVTVKRYEREKSAERSVEHGEQSDLHSGRGLPDSQSGPAATAGEGPGQVREDAPAVLEGASPGSLGNPGDGRDALQPPAGDRGYGQQPSGNHDAPAGESGGGDRTAESQRSDEVGGADERLQSAGGGDYLVGADLQLSFLPPEIPTQQEQIAAIQEAESADAPFAFSVPSAPESPQTVPTDNLSDLQKKAAEIAEKYESLPMSDKIGIIAQAFGCTSGTIETSPCSGKWRGTSDVSIRFDNDTSLFIGNQRTPQAKTVKVQNELINAALARYNPEIVAATKETALAALRKREIRDNEIAAQKGLKPYTLLNVEFNDGADGKGGGYRGWYYVTLAVDGKICAHLESGLAHEIAFGEVSEAPTRETYFTAGALKDADVDYVFNNVGFSSSSDLYSLPISDAVRERAEKALAEHEGRQRPAPTVREQYGTYKPRPVSQEDIDSALQEWNGDIASKRRVQQYMESHAREKGTAAWLKNEYGDNFPAYPVHGADGGGTDLPWSKVQRHLARLVNEDRFFTQEELDNFADIDTAAVREHLEQGSDHPSAFVEQVMADVDRVAGNQGISAPEQKPTPSPTVREVYNQYKPVIKGFVLSDGPYQNACKNSDRDSAVMEGHEAVTRAALAIQDTNFMRLYFDMSAFRTRLHREVIDETYPILSQPQQEQEAVPDLSGQPITREGDTITIGNGNAAHEIDIALSDEEWQTAQEVIGAADLPPHNPLIPPYKVGDTVYLDKTAFEITDIGLSDVQLRDPALPIPLFRAESIEDFERLLRLDSRNSHFVPYLPADLSSVNDDIREVLTAHLLTDRDKGYISGWIRSGENNRGISRRLSEALANRNDTVTLETGDTADYFASTISLEVDIQDKFITRLSMSWDEVAPVLRALWLQELDGFTHEPVQREPVNLEGKLSYQVGDKVAFAYGDHDVSGTIGYIGELNIRIDTGPYVWSHQTVERDFFEDAVRHDERNAGLFSTKEPEQQVSESNVEPEVTPGTATLYPGDKNGLPYDIIVEKLRFDEPEHATEQIPTAENFRITDDNLGVGGPKEKFRRNIEAITTLHQIESDGRQATPAEQEILSRYVGWGGLPDAFDPDKPAWAKEYEKLHTVLSQKEYTAARASSLNAHYTSPTVVKAIYEAIGNMGFVSGNILEPSCGVGNFFGLLPESMAASKLYGVELDSVTGRIAQQLYPKADITVQGYENANFPKDFFDLAIGNVPFGQYSVYDPEYSSLNFSIHNYFFAKTLDRVRPGGIVAFVTSRYTLDAKDSTVRRYLAERADLLGAIRLPNNAFKANAGTEVVSDILFLQKRDRPIVQEPDWVHLGVNEDGFAINSYFVSHPEMILGRQSSQSTQYAGQDFTVEPIEGLLLSDQLHDAVKYIHGRYQEAELPDLDTTEPAESVIPADPTVKNYSFAVMDGDVYYRENSVMVKPRLTAAAMERVKGMVELRDCTRKLIDLQMDEFIPDSAIREQQAELDRLYNSFSAKYGLINDRANRLAFSKDSAYYLLCSLEVLDEDGRLERKADMFTKRTIKRHTAVSRVDTASEALAVSIGERAKIDLPFMAQLTGKTETELTEDLRGVIFKDPAAGNAPLTGWQTSDEYLSGNVRRKLRAAQQAAERDPAFQINVEDLTAVQPKDLDASEIEVRLGTDWIDKSYIQQFMYEVLKTPPYLQKNITVNHSKFTTSWSITGKSSISRNDVAAYTTFGTSRANAYEILEDSLNLRDVRIYDIILDENDKEKRVLNGKETTLAAQKQQALREAFRDWIWKDPQRRQALVRQYNEEMNSTRPREYDGSHLIFPGINPEIRLLPHQVNAIAHVIYGGNTLLAHEVGAGKTFEMIAAAMESKRLGLCQKSIFVVPNHLTEQTASEFLRLYPSANILVTTKRDFQKNNRKKFCARIATGDYDAVIIGHSQFEKIPISMERQERLIQEQIDEITDGIEEVKYTQGDRFTTRQLERTKKNLQARLLKLQANHRKDDVVTFEELGVDRMFVDESDNYKNLFLYTKMRNVAGLSTTDAQKSSDMFAKCRYLDELTGYRGSIFATGTPISNSMTEMFSIQRYLQYNRLEELGMTHFDSWASRFGETTTALELAPEGYTFFRWKKYIPLNL